MADGNNVAEQIADINASKAAIAGAIAAKGVTVPYGTKLGGLAALVGQIDGGVVASENGVKEVYVEQSVVEVFVADGVTTLNTRFTGSTGLHERLVVSLPASIEAIGRYSNDGVYETWCLSGYMNITFEGKTKAQVQALAGYPWDLAGGNTITCTDGDLVVGS